MNVRFSQCCLILVGFVALSSLARADPKLRVQGSVPLRDRQNLPIFQRGGDLPGGDKWDAKLRGLLPQAGEPWGDEERRAFGHAVTSMVRARGPWVARVPVGALLNAPVEDGGIHVRIEIQVYADGTARCRLMGTRRLLVNGVGHDFRMEGEGGEYVIWYYSKDKFDNEINSTLSFKFEVRGASVHFVLEETEIEVDVGWGQPGGFNPDEMNPPANP